VAGVLIRLPLGQSPRRFGVAGMFRVFFSSCRCWHFCCSPWRWRLPRNPEPWQAADVVVKLVQIIVLALIAVGIHSLFSNYPIAKGSRVLAAYCRHVWDHAYYSWLR
jgi:hypothetical protein